MPTKSNLVSDFLKKSHTKNLPRPTAVPNSFQELFAVKPLDLAEKEALERDLIAEISPEEREQFAKDFSHLLQASEQVRAIQKQGILLIGERIFRARQLLSEYIKGKRMLTKWMTHSFSSQKTAYNALAFYDLYQKLPNQQLKDQLKRMPAKASYILASREGELADKCELVSKYQSQFADELIEEIQRLFPTKGQDKRSNRIDHALLSIEKAASYLIENQSIISSKQHSRLNLIIKSIDSLK